MNFFPKYNVGDSKTNKEEIKIAWKPFRILYDPQ